MLLATATGFAQTGTISGTFYKSELGEKVPLAMAKVIEIEQGKFVRTDFDGKFEMPEPVSYTHLTLPTTPYV